MAISEQKAVEALLWAGKAHTALTILSGYEEIPVKTRESLQMLLDTAPGTVKSIGSLTLVQTVTAVAKTH